MWRCGLGGHCNKLHSVVLILQQVDQPVLVVLVCEHCRKHRFPMVLTKSIDHCEVEWDLATSCLTGGNHITLYLVCNA